MKQADELQPWTLSVKFKYSKICKLFRLSIRFKLPPVTSEFESRPESAYSFKAKLLRLKYKFLHKLKKILRRKRSGNGNKRIVSTELHREDSNLKNCSFGRRKGRVWFWVLLFAVVVVVAGFVIMQLRSDFHATFLWDYFFMAWDYVVASEFLQQLFKVILDGLSRYLGF